MRWDHARRKYYDVHASSSSLDTQTLLEMIGELYSIEVDICGKPSDEHLRVRQGKTA